MSHFYLLNRLYIEEIHRQELKMRTEDGEIIYRCLNEDSTAFGLLVDKYKGSIFAIAYSKLRNFHDAEDVTQDVFLKAYKNLRKLKRWDNFLAWLCSMAYNLCRDRIKSQSIHIERLEQKAQEELVDNSVNTYRQEQVYESLHEALDSLPDIYRDVLTLHYLGGISGEQIARILSLPHSTVRQRLSRARTQLREELLAMISETFEQEKLRANFTFRIVEMVKKIRVHPISTLKGLPWGLSLATGIIFTVMSLNPYIPQFSQVGAYIRSVLPSETKVLNIGEIPVDVVKVSNVTILSGKMGKGKSGEPKQPDMQNAFFMAPQGEGDTWTKKADMLTDRRLFSTCAVNGKIYAIGGVNAAGMLSTVEEYDPSTDTWTKKADMPTARYWYSSSCTSVVNGKIYAIGGVNDTIMVRLGNLANVEEYDPVKDIWTKKADAPVEGSLSACSISGKIYLINNFNIDHWDLDKAIFKDNICLEYDPSMDRWTNKAPMPAARNNFSISAANGKIYAIGGVNAAGMLSTVEEYDPSTDTWTKKADMPTARSGLSTIAVNGKIYAIAGDGGGVTVEEYDPATDTWTKKADMLVGKRLFSTSVVGGKIYAMGNMMANPDRSVEEYTPEGWMVSPNGKMPSTWGTLKAK
jgi:RNA polymerase sigma factor (sigma-70 family)